MNTKGDKLGNRREILRVTTGLFTDPIVDVICSEDNWQDYDFTTQSELL